MVRDVAVLFAIGIGPDEFRRVLGVSGDLLDAEVQWGAFFESLVFWGGVCVATLPVPSGAECHSPYAQPENPETHWC